MGVLVNAMIVIILKYVSASNHQAIYLEFIQHCYTQKPGEKLIRLNLPSVGKNMKELDLLYTADGKVG